MCLEQSLQHTNILIFMLNQMSELHRMACWLQFFFPWWVSTTRHALNKCTCLMHHCYICCIIFSYFTFPFCLCSSIFDLLWGILDILLHACLFCNFFYFLQFTHRMVISYRHFKFSRMFSWTLCLASLLRPLVLMCQI